MYFFLNVALEVGTQGAKIDTFACAWCLTAVFSQLYTIFYDPSNIFAPVGLNTAHEQISPS